MTLRKFLLSFVLVASAAGCASEPAPAPTRNEATPTVETSSAVPSASDELAVGSTIPEAELLDELGYAEPPLKPDLTQGGSAAAQIAGGYYFDLLDYATVQNKPELLEGEEFSSCNDCAELQERIRQHAASDQITIYERHSVDVSAPSENEQNAVVADVPVAKNGGRMVTYDRPSQTIVGLVERSTYFHTVAIVYTKSRGWIPVVLIYGAAG